MLNALEIHEQASNYQGLEEVLIGLPVPVTTAK